MCQPASVAPTCCPATVIPATPASVLIRVPASKLEDFPLTKPASATRTTTATYHADPLPGISKTPYAYSYHGASWRVVIPIQVPTDILKPTLSSLRYMVKYGTTFDDGNSTVQADLVLSTANVEGGVTLAGDDANGLKGLYLPAKSGYAPHIVDENTGVSLLTVSSVKCNGGGAQWSHFIDSHQLYPNIRLANPGSHLYLVFNVAEYPTKDTERFLAAEVAASWYEDVEARKAQDEADRKAKEEAVRKAKEEADRIAHEEATKAKKAEEELQKKISDEVARRVAEAEKSIQAEVDKRVADVESKLRAEAQKASSVSKANAPHVADDAMQDKIQAAAKKHNAVCPQGYGWVKSEHGYVCGGGGHKLTWEQLGM